MSDELDERLQEPWRNWPTKDAAQTSAASPQGQVGHFEYCGTLRSVTVCQISTKPASDPDLAVWVMRGTFETMDGAELEIMVDGQMMASTKRRGAGWTGSTGEQASSPSVSEWSICSCSMRR